MDGERVRDAAHNIRQGFEIVGGFIIGFGYILTHPDAAMPEGGWSDRRKAESEQTRGRQRFNIGAILSKIKKSK